MGRGACRIECQSGLGGQNRGGRIDRANGAYPVQTEQQLTVLDAGRGAADGAAATAARDQRQPLLATALDDPGHLCGIAWPGHGDGSSGPAPAWLLDKALDFIFGCKQPFCIEPSSQRFEDGMRHGRTLTNEPGAPV